MTRANFITLHRYAGLLIAFFLILTGATGALLAFYDELDASLNPNLHYVDKLNDSLSFGALVNQVETRMLSNKAKIQSISFPKTDRRSVEIRVVPAPGATAALNFNRIFVDPYTGAVLGSRQWGAWRFDRAHLMPLVYKLHYSLTLPGPWGTWLLGGAALIWFFDCFTGIYLTLPRRRNRFLKKWQRAWSIKWWSSTARIIHDSHLALSLWLWGMLLVMALSGVMFNLNGEIYRPVVTTVMPYERVRDTLPDAAEKVRDIGFPQALLNLNEELEIWQKEADFTVQRKDALSYDAAKHAYRLRVHSSLDLPESYSQTRLYISANDGRLLAREHAYHDAGNAVTTWLAALHMAKVFGLWYRIFVSVLAICITIITISGVLIWWRKFRLRTSNVLDAGTASIARLPASLNTKFIFFDQVSLFHQIGINLV
ncbi:MAG: PepSY-associated TM helix domain-containing protein [Exilibacterium sp.]